MKSITKRMLALTMAVVMLFTTGLADANTLVARAEETKTVAAWNVTAQANFPIAATSGEKKDSASLSFSKTGLTAGFGTNSVNVTGAQKGDRWLISVDANGYTNMSFTAKMRSSNTGAKNFGLEYSMDGGESWAPIEDANGQVAAQLTPSLAYKFNNVTLPAALAGKSFILGLRILNDESVNGKTIGSGGVTNINNISITGTPGDAAPETKVANVTASPVSGSVLTIGDAVTLSCATSGAAIYYNMDDSANFVQYKEPLVVTKDTVIKAYASKEGLESSDVDAFTYKVVKPALPAGTRLEGLEDKDEFVLYSSYAKGVMTSVVGNKGFGMAKAEISDEGILKVTEPTTEAENTAKNSLYKMTAHVDEDGIYTFTNENGQFLSTEKTGNGLKFIAEADDYSLWTVNEHKATVDGVETVDGYTIKNVNASYTDSNSNETFDQYVEYYNEFYCASYKAKYEAQYLVNFFVMPEIPEDAVIVPVKEKLAKKADTVKDGDMLVLYNAKNKMVIGANALGKVLAGVEAEVKNVKDVDCIAATDDMAQLIASKVSDDEFTFTTSDGKYLTSGATGSNLYFADTKTDYAYWNVEAAANGAVYLKNVNAKFNEKNQYIEYYKGFTTFGFSSSSATAYELIPFVLRTGLKTYNVDDSVSSTLAQFAGNANYADANVDKVIYGDKFSSNDLLDTNSEFTVVISGKNEKPYMVTDGTSLSYYMGAKGVGSGDDDYIQMTTSSAGFGAMKLAFRLRASDAAAGEFAVQYSNDGENFENFTTGSYAYAYTKYGSNGASENISKEGEITDGIARTSMVSSEYISFKFDVPAFAANADKLYIRLVPGKGRVDGKESAIGKTATLRVDSVVLTGSPIVDENITGHVMASIKSGEAALGSKVALTTATENAKIFYSFDGDEYSQYEEAFTLDKLPASLYAYATAEGKADSIKMRYDYTQAKVANVKLTPNGGSVVKGTKVTIKCPTEGAKILYRFVKETADENIVSKDENDWLTYDADDRPALTELPATIEVKGVKEGYLDSAVSKAKFTEKGDDHYKILFGQIHAHTNFSDGAGSCEEAFDYATKVDDLDFLAVTDHSNSLDNAENSVISKNVDVSENDEWSKGHALAKQYSSDDFTCIYGYEMTWSNGLGHMNTFNTEGFQSRNQKDYSTYSTALSNYYTALNTVPDSMSMFNHPGTTFGDFQDFAYYSEANDALITMIEVGNGEGAIGSSGYFPSYEYYTRALDKGWHVAPANNQDNHKGKWGDANTARTVVLADANNEESIYDAMRNYRMYATEDNNLSIYYTLDNNIMGSVLDQDQVGDNVEIKVELSDATNDAIGKVDVIVNGGLTAASENVEEAEKTLTFNVPSSYSYYYIKVTEKDGDIAVTSPVWVGETEACGINSTYTNSPIAVQGEEIDLHVDLYNNEKQELVIDNVKITCEKDDYVAEVLDKTGAELSVAALASNSTATIDTSFTCNQIGAVEYHVEVAATLNGVAKTYKDVLKLNYTTPALVTEIIVDGTHYNDYVTGYYGGNMSNFVELAGDKNIRVSIETEEVTKSDLINADGSIKAAALVVSAPAKKTGTANAGDFTVSHFEDSFIELVKEYVAAGGTVIVCGLADYQDTKNGQTATEQNKLLSAIGSTIRMNSDEVYDEVNNGGQAFRLYPTNFNMNSKYLQGIVDGQKYSQYSGCSVNIDNAGENDVVNAAEALVSGFDTTYSINCKDDNGNSVENTVYVEKGHVTFLAHQTTKAGGNIFVAGGVFISDFEVKAEIDNPDSLPYANYTIAQNILTANEKQLGVTDIATARKADLGQVFAVEGYVTAGTTNPNTTFFDSIYIQDETAGIDIFPYATAGLAIGTKVRITGYVDEYQGDRELQVISSQILDAEPYVWEARAISTKDATDYDNFGGMLVKTTGQVTKVEYTSDKQGVAEFWVKDETGVEAAVFIDGYILSGTTGKNTLADFVKVGATVTGQGLLYKHPEGDSDISVPVLRVRDCDEIILVKEAIEVAPEEPTQPEKPSKPAKPVKPVHPIIQPIVDVVTGVVDTVTTVVGNIIGAISNFIGRVTGKTSRAAAATIVEEEVPEAVEEAAVENSEDEISVDTNESEDISNGDVPLAGQAEDKFPVAPVAGVATLIIIAGIAVAINKTRSKHLTK